MNREALEAEFGAGRTYVLDGRLEVVAERHGSVLSLRDREGTPLWDPPVEDGYPELRPEYAGLSMFLTGCEHAGSFRIARDGDAVLIGPHRLEPAGNPLRRPSDKARAKHGDTKAMKKNTKKQLERCLKGVVDNTASSSTSALKALMEDIDNAQGEEAVEAAKERFLSALNEIHGRYASVAADALSSVNASDLTAGRFDETVRAFLDEITGCSTVDVSMLGNFTEAILCNSAKCHVDYLVRHVSDRGDCRSEGVLVGIYRDRHGRFYLQGKLPSGSTEFMELAGGAAVKCRYLNSVHAVFKLPPAPNDDGTPSNGADYVELKKSTYTAWLDGGVLRGVGIPVPERTDAQSPSIASE